MLESVESLKAVPIPVNGGVDEVSPGDGLRAEDALKMTNWRLSKDGRRIQKRAGLQEEVTAFAEDIYGYTTYHDSSSNFCQLAILEGQVMRKVAAGSWTQIYDWPALAIIDHIVKPLEAQGKQFIITEKGSRVILPNGDVRQIGITAPTTVPTATASYTGTGANTFDHDMDFADQAAMDAEWIDYDDGAGASTLDATDPDLVPGPDADAKYMRLYSSDIGNAKRRHEILSNLGNVYAVQVDAYFDDLASGAGGFYINIGNQVVRVYLNVTTLGVRCLQSNDTYAQVFLETVPLNKWIRWNISVDSTDENDVSVSVFMTYDSMIKGSGTITLRPHEDSSSPYVALSTTAVFLYGPSDVHIDHITIRPFEEDEASITGLYRYAVSFCRDGDYGYESNPIKSQIGAITFTGAGLNDMTLNDESSYTGAVSKTLRVEVKTAAAPQDTIRWSDDGGLTWLGEIKLQPKVYLSMGVTVNFGAITGHTAGNYWEIPCLACSAISTMQQITVTGIPTSTDEQVTARKIYRTTANGSKFYYLTTIYDRATTTEFVDNFADALLGDEMEEDRDLFTEASSTIGKFAEIWDGRLWVADHAENVVYYSAIRDGGPVPEEFSLDERFIPINRGDQDDEITAMKAFKDALYVFKRNDIYVIQKTSLGYAPYHLNSDLGCVAANCVEVVNDFLMFPSERGIEFYDGVRQYSPEFSVTVDTTYRTVDPTYYKFMSIAHDKEFNEVWVSIPSRLAGAAAITIVWNYIRNKFYFFQFYKTPSCLVRCKDSTGKSVLKMGTRDGYLLLCDYGTADHTTAITATYRKGWLDLQAHGIGRLIQTDYELPASMTLTLNVYVDFDKDVFRTAALAGSSPTTTDATIRRIITDKTELGVRGRHMSIEYTNAQDCGGDCKVNDVVLYARPDVVKKKTYGD